MRPSGMSVAMELMTNTFMPTGGQIMPKVTETETWWFSVVDIVQVLTRQPDYQTARKYWNKPKERLGKRRAVNW